MPKIIEPFYAELGRRIRDYRIARHLTQDQLGDRLSPPTTRVSIANVESGKQRVLSHTLVQFAQILGVPPTELLPSMEAPSYANDHDIAHELVSKAGLSKTNAEKLLGNRNTLRAWKDESS